MKVTILLLTAALAGLPLSDASSARAENVRRATATRNSSRASQSPAKSDVSAEQVTQAIAESPYFHALGVEQQQSVFDAPAPRRRKGKTGDAPVIRGQSPATLMPIVVDPQDPANNGGPLFPSIVPSDGSGLVPYSAFQSPMVPVDPFNAGQPLPYPSQPFAQQMSPPFAPAPQAGSGLSFGLNGPQAYRYGWTARYDLAYMPNTNTNNPNVGKFGIFAVDIEKEWVAPLPGNWTFSMAPQIGYRGWSGPYGQTPGVGPVSLPGSVYSVGLGLKLDTPVVNGFSAELGFDPHLGTDFNHSPNRRAVMLDAYGVAFIRTSPQFMWALGAAYWERADRMIIPYAGFVWNPSDYVEFRIVLPKPRVSVFLGTPWGVPTWLYAQGEYHVEAYQIAIAGSESQIQLADYRATAGLKFDAGWFSTYVEAGYIFNRDVKFHGVGQNFHINDGYIARVGWRY